jgi:hypothetical protein
MKNFTKFVIWIFGLLSLVACSNKITETQRISNISNSIDAVLAIKETGATVAIPTEVYLLPKGQQIHGEPVFRADNVEGLKLIWDGESTLKIHAEKARVFLHSSSLKIDAPDRKSQLVSIQLAIKDLR